MNTRTTLILFVLVLIAAAAALLLDQRGDGADIRSTAPSDSAVLLPSVDTIDERNLRLRITRDERHTTIAFERQRWMQTEPVRFALRAEPVQQVITTALSLRYVDRFEPGADGRVTLDEAGLSAPRVVLTLEGEPAGTLRLGKRILGGRAYVQVDDDPRIHVVGDALHALLLYSDVRTWRARSLDVPPAGRVRSIELRRGDTVIELTQTEGEWRFAPPHVGRVDASSGAALLDVVAGFHIAEFLGDDPRQLSALGLDQPGTTLSITSSDHPHPLVLRLGEVHDLAGRHRAATWSTDGDVSSVAFSIRDADAAGLNVGVDDLRDPRVTVIAAEAVRRIELSSDSADIELVRGVEGVTVTRDGIVLEAEHDGEAIITAVTDLHAESYAVLPRPDTPTLMTITIEGIGYAEPDVLRIYQHTTDTAFVYRNDEPIGHIVTRETLRALPDAVSHASSP